MAYAIETSDDFERVKALPKRAFSREQAERDARELTAELVTPAGRAEGVSLRPLQGYVLRELWEHRGVYASISVGAGKTLLSYLAAYVMNAKRPVLVVPEALRDDKTPKEFAEYAKYWVTPRPMPRLIGYKELTRVSADDLIARLEPDLWIFDEVDILANQGGSATRRVALDIDARNVPVLAMTGTDGRFSITDFSHFITWALKENAPLPLDPDTLQEWASALDEKRPGDRRSPNRPGVLLHLTTTPVAEPRVLEIGVARQKLQARMAETPGIIMLDDDDCTQPLTIRHVCAPEDALLNEHFEVFRTEQVTPDGWDVTDPLSEWALDQELGSGFHHIVVDSDGNRPPEVWRDTRRTFARFVRRRIEDTAGNRRPLYTELMVKQAFPDHPAIVAWREVEPTFTPISVPVWLSDSVVHAAARWAQQNVGLIWVPHLTVGERIAKAAGLGFYGAKGLTAAGSSIERADPGKAAVLSIGSNLRGRNLQAWNKNLLIGCPQSAKFFEQLIGRTHRYGQKRPVTADVMLTSSGSLYSFDMLIKEAQFVLSVRGKRQKILRADIRRTTFRSEALRWAPKPVR